MCFPRHKESWYVKMVKVTDPWTNGGKRYLTDRFEQFFILLELAYDKNDYFYFTV